VTTANYLCIGCPLGCRLEVDEADDGHVVEVRGFACKRGNEYALQEHTAPHRMVTTTVYIECSIYARLPVRTSKPVSKNMVADICQVLRSLKVVAPIQRGAVLFPNVLNTGVDVIASRSMAAV
jgi:CxxC motif-containing protein